MRPRPLRDLALAITQLTVIPLPVRWPQDEKPDVASYYVWVGLLVGAIAYVPIKLVDTWFPQWHAYSLVAAALVMAGWALLTRFMHLDGFADTMDGWFAPDPQRRREIASDSHIGAFGATAIAIAALLEFAALSGLLYFHESIVLIVPAFSRLAGTAAAWFGRPAKPDGMGASVARKPSLVGVIATGSGVLLACVLIAGIYRKPGLAVGMVGLLLALVVPHLVAKRFGGVTGDVMGASILIVEVVLFFAAVAVVH
jgi:adenosylcobinamide-GDP ribazoletransferase